MQKIRFEYKGTMIKVTEKLKEEFEYDIPLKYVKDALDALNNHYDQKLNDYVSKNISIVLKREDGRNFLITSDEGLNIELGRDNTIIFYYPFKGG